MGRNLGGTCDHDASLLGSSPRSVFGCALANPIVDGNSETRQVAQREECPRYEKHGRLLKETAKLSTATRKNGQLVMRRMPQLLEEAQPPRPLSASVDQTGSQPLVVSESRCRAKLHGISKQAQRHSRDGLFYLLVGGPARLVSSQIARLSSLGIESFRPILTSTAPLCATCFVVGLLMVTFKLCG